MWAAAGRQYVTARVVVILKHNQVVDNRQALVPSVLWTADAHLPGYCATSSTSAVHSVESSRVVADTGGVDTVVGARE